MASVRPKGKKWMVDYRVCGQRRRETFDTKKEAQDFKRDLLLRPVDSTIGFKPIKTTRVEKACDQYFDLCSNRPGRPKKNINSEGDFLHELNDFLRVEGVVTVDQVTLAHMQKFQVADSKRNKKCRYGAPGKIDPNTVNRKFDFYRHAFEQFVAWEFTRENPMAKLKRLPKIQKPKKIWTKELVTQVLNTVPAWMSDIYWFMAMTGCRAGAASALNWGDVDFELRTISLRTRKGKGSNEKIYQASMTEPLRQFLLEHKACARGAGSPVFLNFSGDRVTAKHLSTEMWHTLKALGLEGYKLHGLRDTFCTLVANAGGIHRAQRLAGHSDIKTTQIYYRESADDLMKTADVIPFERREVAG